MKKVLILLLSATLLAGCNLLPQKSSSSSADPTASTTSTSSSTTQSSVPGEFTSRTYHLSKNYLPFTNYGIHIGNDASGYQNRNALLVNLNQQNEAGLITQLSADNCTILTDDGSSDQEHLHLAVGTGSAAGFIEFYFRMNITKVSVEVMAYYKTPYSVETGALVSINGEDHQIPSKPATEAQDVYTFEKTLSEPTDVIKLSNNDEDQRFYLESLTIYYK